MDKERLEELKRSTTRKIKEDKQWAIGEPMPRHVSDYWDDLLTVLDEAIARTEKPICTINVAINGTPSPSVSNLEKWKAELTTGRFETIVGDNTYWAHNEHHPDVQPYLNLAITALQAFTEPRTQFDKWKSELTLDNVRRIACSNCHICPAREYCRKSPEISCQQAFKEWGEQE